MGSTTSTQTTTTPGASGQEQQLMTLLAKLAQSFSGQMGDLSQLAQGGVGGPTEQDVGLVQQSIGRTGEIAQRELERVLGPLMAQLSEQTAGRGIGGSSMEQLSKILAGRELSGRTADLMAGAQQQGGQALMNLPFMRAESKLGANQALFQMLSGAANPVLANQLQSRLAQQTTKMDQPMDWMSMLQAGGAVGAAPFTGGASLAGIGIPGFGK